MANFYGHQSLNGLATTQLFTADAAGTYFISGALSLPQLSTGAGASAVVVTVNKNVSTGVYTGIAGASGFQLPALVLAAGDAVAVVLSSAAAPDLTLNAVSGQVVFGNAF